MERYESSTKNYVIVHVALPRKEGVRNEPWVKQDVLKRWGVFFSILQRNLPELLSCPTKCSFGKEPENGLDWLALRIRLLYAIALYLRANVAIWYARDSQKRP